MFSEHMMTIWFGSDFIVIGFIVYSVVICTVDLIFDTCGYIMKHTHLKMHCYDIMLGHIIIIGCLLVLADMAFGFLHLLAIVDYGDAMSSIIRTWIISRLICLYCLFGVISSLILAIKAKKHRIKWFIYGLFLNCFAILYYWKALFSDRCRE
jgi:hypothetical protein